MANTLNIPFVAGIPFYDVNIVQYPKYLTRFVDDYQFVETLNPWDEQTKYFAKWQKSDVLVFSIEATFAPLDVRIINKYGNTVGIFTPSRSFPHQYIPGVLMNEFSIPFVGLADGCYFLQLTNGNPAELNMVSEPIYVKDVHPNTKMFEYSNSHYYLDVLWESGIVFNMRMEATFDLTRYGADIKAYEDQRDNPTILSAIPFDILPLVVGGSYGVPEWVLKRLNMILTCDRVSIDGVLFARNNDSQIQYNRIENYPMRGATIELKPGLNRTSKIVSPGLDPNKKMLVTAVLDSSFFGGLTTAGQNTLKIIDSE